MTSDISLKDAYFMVEDDGSLVIKGDMLVDAFGNVKAHIVMNRDQRRHPEKYAKWFRKRSKE